MTGILGRFHVDHDTHGARVVARSLQLTGQCSSNDEVDDAVQALKDDLDACAREMKRFIELNGRGALFEGWPSPKDGVLDT